MATSTGFTAFARRVQMRSKEIRDNAELRVKVAVSAGIGVIVPTTPVDTGLARNNWNIVLGDLHEPALRVPDKSGSTSTSWMIQQLQNWSIESGDAITFINPVDYVAFLDQGSSQQAPAGITPRVIQAMISRARSFKLMKRR